MSAPTREFGRVSFLFSYVVSLRRRLQISRRLRWELLGWLVSLLAFSVTTALDSGMAETFLLIHFIFLFRISKPLFRMLRPPTEILLLIFYLLFLLDLAIRAMALSWANGDSSFAGSLHFFLLGLLGLLFALHLVGNSQEKRGALIWFMLLLSISDSFLLLDNWLGRTGFMAVVFFSVLRQTRWLASLSKRECYVYLPLSGLLFYSLHKWAPLSAPQELSRPEWWLAYPGFYFLLLKFSLLATALKIPVVLVYNHARLSRKLKIAGLFQSTFPQVMQLVVLLLMFYFLIAGWQADRLKTNLQAAIDPDSHALANPTTVMRYAVVHPPADTAITLPGHEPLFLSAPLPEEGILRLDRVGEEKAATGPDFFLFRTITDSSGVTCTLVRLDSTFFRQIAAVNPPFVGNKLLAYAHFPSRWEQWLYRFDFLAHEKQMRIFPFGFVTHRADTRLAADFVRPDQRTGGVSANKARLSSTVPQTFTVGRVLSPLYNSDLRPAGYYAFDIAFFPDERFFTSPVFRFALYLLGIYLLMNYFFIRRVVKLGAEINAMIVEKFDHLRKGISEVASGNLDYQIRLEGQDEFVELAENFNRLGGQLKKSIEEAREKERLEQELKIAREVQLSLLPKSLPEIPHFEVAATLETAEEVGGDFYDLLDLGRGRFLFTLGDVSGKSTSAAFYMAQCISLIRFAPQFSTDLLEILERLNYYFTDARTDKQIFVTAVLGLLDAKRNWLQFARAGHTPPLLLTGNAETPVAELAPAGMGIGLVRDFSDMAKAVKVESIALAPGEALVLYSDGLVEASRPHPQKGETIFYGEERLTALLATLWERSAHEIVQTILEDLKRFYEDHQFTDDISLMVIRRR